MRIWRLPAGFRKNLPKFASIEKETKIVSITLFCLRTILVS